MRPRHYAADNITLISAGEGNYNASMRPRHYAADNALLATYGAPALARASMRPRHYAADNPAQVATALEVDRQRFNEAAALRRG